MANFCNKACLDERCKQCLMAIEEVADDGYTYDDFLDPLDEVSIYTGLDQIDWEDDGEYR